MKFDMTPEQLAKAEKCTTAQELLDFIRDEGIQLSDEDLEKATGGVSWDTRRTQMGICPLCSGQNVQQHGFLLYCNDCQSVVTPISS